MDKSLCIEASISGEWALLCLNGMVLGKLGPGCPLAMSVHEYLAPGSNTIQLMQPGATRCREPAQYHVQVYLHKDRGPDCIVQKQVVFVRQGHVERWAALHGGCLLDVQIDVPVHLQAWSFLELRSVKGSAADLPLLESHSLSLLRSIVQRDLQALQLQFLPRNRELALAYGLELDSVSRQFSAMWADLLEHHELMPASLDPSSWRFQAVAGSCLYWVCLDDYSPCLQFRSLLSTARHCLPVHLAVLNSNVFVIR